MRVLLATLTMAIAAAAPQARVVRHVLVYRESGRFGGWPANHGIWSWGDEIVVGFSAAYFQIKSPDRHQYDNTKAEEPRLARSVDGGETWTVEAPLPCSRPSREAAPSRTSRRRWTSSNPVSP